MASEVHVGIDIQQAVLRYAEVKRRASQKRLLRLGSCDFTFDVAKDVFGEGEPERLETVAEALADVFAGTAASHLDVVLHPPHGYSFFTPVPTALSEQKRTLRLQEEASLLTQVNVAEALHLTEDALYAETREDEQVEWFHVLGVDKRIRTRLDRLVSALPQLSYRLKLSMHGVATAMVALQETPVAEREADQPPFGLAIGWYPTHVEYTICRGADWYFSHHAQAGAPEDGMYFAVTLLNRLDIPPRAVRRLYLYGSERNGAAFESLQDIFDTSPERLDPMRVVRSETGRFAGDFDPSAYAPCIGAVL